MKALFTHPQWQEFEEWLDKEESSSLAIFLHLDRDGDMHRIQGTLKLIGKIRALKEKTLKEKS
jgi:hypothetical protein